MKNMRHLRAPDCLGTDFWGSDIWEWTFGDEGGEETYDEGEIMRGNEKYETFKAFCIHLNRFCMYNKIVFKKKPNFVPKCHTPKKFVPKQSDAAKSPDIGGQNS